MDSRQLRYFARVVELGSLSQAAESLHVAQSALSAHMRHLEEELGVRLLLRTSRGVRVTPHGQLLHEHAVAILRLFDQARQEVSSLGKAPAGEVVIGMPGSVSPSLVQPLLAALKRQAPMVTLRVVEAMSGYLLEWLHSGRVDIAVLFSTQSEQGLRRAILPEEPVYLVGHRNAFGPGEKLAMRDLPRYPLVLPGKMHGGSQLIRDAASRLNVSLNVQVEVDAVGEMMGLIEQGVGYTPMVPMGFTQRLARGEVSVARLVRPSLARRLAVATADVRPITTAMELVQAAVIELLTATMRRHAVVAVAGSK